MAFKDIKKEMYGGRVLLEYADKTHRYSATVDGKKMPRPASVTGVKGDTLEKKGLQTWPMGLALRHLFGFYGFKNDQGNQMNGFSAGVGTIWQTGISDREKVLEECLSASKAWTRKQNEGADVGTLVHDAVEQYITGTPFTITVDKYREKLLEKVGPFENQAEADAWEERAPGEVEMALRAYGAFTNWWDKLGAKVILAEEILYSLDHNLAGTMDYLLEIPGKGLVLSDLKTTKASKNAGAPEGVYYDFMVQLGIYASMLKEMDGAEVDDLMIISARKDGEFSTVYASDLGLSVMDCMAWGESVILCYKLMKQTKKALVKHAGGQQDEED